MRFFILMLLFATNAQSYPDRIKDGYKACLSCHVSPSGGGVLTDYGKGLSTQMTTFANNEEIGFSDWGLSKVKPEGINLGGNIRYLYLYQTTSQASRETSLLMQADLELSYSILKSLTLVGSMGVYGINLDEPEDPEIENRRYYALYSYSDKVKVRYGRFFPNFGLMIEDHTDPIRSVAGFKEGKESKNTEIGYYGKLFSLIYSDVNTNSIESIFKLEVYLGQYASSSLSLLRGDIDKMSMAFKLGCKEKYYLMTEGLFTEDESEDVYFLRTGYEIRTGILPYFKFSKYQTSQYSYGVQWLPIAHLDLQLESTWMDDYFDYSLVSNYYF